MCSWGCVRFGEKIRFSRGFNRFAKRQDPKTLLISGTDMRVNLRILFVATIIVVASCRIDADNTDGKWKLSTNSHGRTGQHAHVSGIIEQYLLDSQALESFLEKHVHRNEKRKLPDVNKLFASHLASFPIDHLMSLPADASSIDFRAAVQPY